jgi:SAM-dependent methyltransferase
LSLFSIKSRIITLIGDGRFNPTIVSMFTNPFYIIRKGLFEGVRANAHLISGKTLDFGCGSKPYSDFFAHTSNYVGCDIQVSGHNHLSSKVDVFYDGSSLPFEDQSFNSVVSFETFEHIFNIDSIVKEIHRVLQPRGQMLITIPFVWEEHEVPYDYARYSTYGIRHILETNGFEIVKIERLGDYLDVVSQLMMAYLVGTVSSEKIRLLLTGIVQPVLLLIKSFAQMILPKSNKLFLNTLIVARRI